MKEETILAEARQITKTFPGVKALDEVNLRIYAGKVNAIMGENGAGKSTLMNILSGVYSDYEGKILIDGKEQHFNDTTEARRQGISMIHQELHLIPYLNIAENIFLGNEPTTAFGLIDHRRMHQEARKLLDRLHTDIDTHTMVNDLRVGQQQLVEIAKALSTHARILIMDEPTSSLSAQETTILFQLIRELCQQGVGIVYITHKMDELKELADYVTVMRDGKTIDELPVKGLDTDHIIRLMVGRTKDELYVKDTLPDNQKEDVMALQVNHLYLHDKEHPHRFVLQDISFEARQGEVLGIYGLMGAGRTELFETIFGMHPKDTEYVGADDAGCFIHGRKTVIKNTSDAIAAHIAYLPEDRKRDGLVMEMDIRHNTTLTALQQFVHYGTLSKQQEEKITDDYRGQLSIRSHSNRQLVNELSGGNQQKVVLAKWLLTAPGIILLDEPTRGIDILAKSEIYRIIDQLAQEGHTILVVSSELPEIMAVSDRIITLCQGKVGKTFTRDNFSEEEILKAALPQE
ncbi:MAG: sugar ABC transporter ATP-binding protein [Prevotella sp.]|nr:sugar ABC transporter ATP-binding protein [Prevotella sp.]